MTSQMFGLLVLAILGVAAIVFVSGRVRRVRVNAWERAAVYVDGVFDRLLEPGRHTVWGQPRRVTLVHTSLDRQYAVIGHVDVVAGDRAPLRLGATVVYRIEDVALSLREPVWTAINLATSTALVRLASGRTLEELMAHGPELDTDLTALVGERIGAARIESVALTGLTLPPELRRLMTEVERARLEGLAALERARGEQAALRSLANAARLLKDNPELAQLRTLQAVGAARNATLVIGDTSGVPKS
ncbi:SPFH domain-containing protein [Brevundimonas staleyi]|uniref:SPFH domain-containing protein n=1 Tax=Brevundimonas staleyi TaxID=74326 RepID=A0ABW0FP97_9CAUL